MLPKNTHKGSRVVRRYEVITPAGRVYRFPRPSLLQRSIWLLYPYAHVAAISSTIFVLIYIAGLAARALEPSMLDACTGITRLDEIS
jgi:hypothetical protein